MTKGCCSWHQQDNEQEWSGVMAKGFHAFKKILGRIKFSALLPSVYSSAKPRTFMGIGQN